MRDSERSGRAGWNRLRGSRAEPGSGPDAPGRAGVCPTLERLIGLVLARLQLLGELREVRSELAGLLGRQTNLQPNRRARGAAVLDLQPHMHRAIGRRELAKPHNFSARHQCRGSGHRSPPSSSRTPRAALGSTREPRACRTRQRLHPHQLSRRAQRLPVRIVGPAAEPPPRRRPRRTSKVSFIVSMADRSPLGGKYVPQTFGARIGSLSPSSNGPPSRSSACLALVWASEPRSPASRR